MDAEREVPERGALRRRKGIFPDIIARARRPLVLCAGTPARVEIDVEINALRVGFPKLIPRERDAHPVGVDERQNIHAPPDIPFRKVFYLFQSDVRRYVFAGVHGVLREQDGRALSREKIYERPPLFRKAEHALFPFETVVKRINFL